MHPKIGKKIESREAHGTCGNLKVLSQDILGA
jgi:hypothetical protein